MAVGRAELVRYFGASLLALLIDLSIFSIALRIFGMPWIAAATVAFLAGAAAAYILSIRLVFRNRSLAHTPRVEFFAFAALGGVGLIVTQLVLWVGIELFGLHPELTKLGAAVVTFFVNYGLRKILLFRGGRLRPGIET